MKFPHYREIGQEIAGLETVIAYGSGVFQQNGYDLGIQPQTDYIFVIDNTREFHRKNMISRPEDYSEVAKKLGYFTSDKIGNIGPGIYYNPFVNLKIRDGENSNIVEFLIKYGVISRENFLHDLKNWTSLYIAGRLHKPVDISGIELHTDVIKANREQALKTALLLNIDIRSEKSLYESIANISYTGDSRMKYGENPNKVENIVSGSFRHFQNIYSDIVQGAIEKGLIETNSEGILQKEVSLSLGREILSGLPIGVRQKIGDGMKFANTNELSTEIRKAIFSIVSSASKIQTVKGIYTAGPKRSFNYAIEKLKKRYKST